MLNVWTLFLRMSQASSFEDAEARLAALKAEAERNWKAQAYDAHPDRGGCEERMKALNAARDAVAKVNIERPRPRPQIVFVQVQYGAGGFTATSSTTGGFHGF